MQFLRANTQVKVVIGPVVAVANGYVPVTTLDLSTADEAELLKHDAGSVTDISAATFAAITSADGYYNLTLTTSHTDTEGLLTVLINDDSLCLPVKQTFMVLAEAAYDSLFVAKDDGFMDVNIKTIGRADTQETEASNLETACANYSATRGLSGTALPAAAADAAGGLPISDAGNLDLDNRMPAAAAVTNINTVFNTDFAANYDTTGDCWLVRLDDGVTHGGTSALLRLGSSSSTPALYVTNSGGNVVRFQATGGNGTALKLDADGTGHGLAAVGGASSGDGFNLGGGGGGPAGAGAAINGGLLGNVTGNVSGSVGSVTGAVGSVTGNVGGNVTGSIGSLATQAKADVNAEADSAIETYHLDHLLAAAYDPASKPGAADALLNELVENDGGVARFTENALEQAPSGVGAGDWTSDEKTAIRSILGIPSSGTTPDDPTVGILDTIRDAVGVVDGVADTLEVELAKVPKSDGTATWNATALASIQSECNDALVAYDPPTNAEMETRTLAAASYATAANQTTIAGYLDTEIAAILADVVAIKAKTDNLPAAPAATGDIPSASAIATAVLTTAMTEAYAAKGATMTLAQFAYIVHQGLFDSSRSGTTWTLKKLDQSTTAATATYDDATNPTAVERAT